MDLEGRTVPITGAVRGGGACKRSLGRMGYPRRFTRRLTALAVLAALVAGVVAGIALARATMGPPRPAEGAPLAPFAPEAQPQAPEAREDDDEPFDPLAWDPDREEAFVQRARDGHAHPLYTRSPGGAVRSAARTARWRPLIERAAAQADIAPEVLEGMVFLESAGRGNAVAGDDLSGAVGLTQILAETGQNLLGMEIDVERSEELTADIAEAFDEDDAERADRLRARRQEVDQRFDPEQALAATARYIRFARGEVDRDDLAVVSYHMGVGNLTDVLDLYGDDDASYAQVYFDSSRNKVGAYRKLMSLGDDSQTYLWRVGAAQDIMALWRSDRAALERLQALHDEKNSAEEVLRPEADTEVLEDGEALEEAYASGDLLALDAERMAGAGLRIDEDMGELARDLERETKLYRGLRPEALATLLYMGTATRQIAGADPLIVTSTVRDLDYQEAIIDDGNPEATRDYSLHTTGFSFDVERRYRSEAQSLAFQFLLDRLQSLNLIAWVREPAAIHVTVGPQAEELLGVLE